MKKIYLLCCNLLLLSPTLNAQVGVNTPLPNTNTILHISEDEHGGGALGRGVLIPRMSISDRDAIPVDSHVDQQDNGLLIYNTTENCFNYWNFAEQLWNSLCGKIGKAQLTIDNCDSIEVKGDYKRGVALSNHYIEVPVTVHSRGTYMLTATTSTTNGYYFTHSGEFLETGKYIVKIPAVGTPEKAQNDRFTVLINGIAANGDQPACQFGVTVSGQTDFKMNCSSVKVNGVYTVNQRLNASHTIQVAIQVDPSSVGAGSMYHMQTDRVDGIRFTGSGLITARNQVVTLYGEGTPTSDEVKNLTITANSNSNSTTCKAKVFIAIPSKKLLTIGTSENGYGYNFSGSAASNKLITTPSNYGMLNDSRIKFQGWSSIINGGNHPRDESLRSWLLGNQPVDILVIGYSWSMSDSAADIITEYLARGGVVLAFSESNSGVRRLFRNLFASSSIDARSGGGAGTLYNLSYTNDEILNGPFGDIRGKKWGEDASYTTYVSNLPSSEVYIYSDAAGNELQKTSSGDREGITALRHRSLNFIWVGDGGFNSNHSGHSSTICPFKLDHLNYPIPKSNYGNHSSGRTEVYNAIFTANAFAWAIKQAHFMGINTL